MGDQEAVEAARAGRRADLQRTESVMGFVRAAGVVFAVVQTLAYRPPPGIVRPDYVRPGGLALAALLAVAGTAVWALNRRIGSLEHARLLALAGLALDVVVVSAFVWLFTFDPASALWAVLFIVPLEGALKFQLTGALATWAIVTVSYIGREVWGALRYEHPLLWESISFRMGLNLLIAIVAGSMARDLLVQRARVEASYRELTRTDALRQHLVSTLAHDVRTPLTSVRGAVQTLLRRPDLADAQREQLLQSADRQAGRLAYLAGDLLDLARLEQGKLELDTEAVRVCDAVAEALVYADGETEVEVAVPGDVCVVADPRRLEQVLVNLVINALRHGEPPYRVEAERAGDDVRLTVRNYGPGVPQDKREQLFQPFASGDGEGSVGLGLWICLMLVEAQGGALVYEPAPDGSSCFTITLPAADASSPAER